MPKKPIQSNEDIRLNVIAAVEEMTANGLHPTLDGIQLAGVQGAEKRIYRAWDEAIQRGELPPRAKFTGGYRGPYNKKGQVHDLPPPPPRDEQPHLRVVTLQMICRQWCREYSRAWSGRGNTFKLGMS